MDAVDSDGKHAPNGKQLGDMLADKFLGGDFRNLPLNQISELAISEADLTTVQDFIRKIFEKLAALLLLTS